MLKNISSFFSDAKDIKLCVYESLSDLSADVKLKGWVAADDVEDTGILHDEIRTLRAENEALKARIAQAEKVRQSRPGSERSGLIQEIIDVLAATEIAVPAAAAAGGKEFKIDLLSCFYNNKDSLVAGVTNAINISSYENFLYFTLCPKLQIHGLVEDEKVAGVRYRRSFVTKLGKELLAECDKRIAKNKKPQQSEPKVEP